MKSRNSQHRDWWVFRYRRLRLQRPGDGKVYQERWGLEVGPAHRAGETDAERAARDGTSWGRLYLHRFDAPDPGEDVHDHPWVMRSLILAGGYTERLYDVVGAFRSPPRLTNGRRRTYRRGSVHRMGLDRAHQIIDTEPGTWTVMVGGRYRRRWGFYVEDGGSLTWIDRVEYEETARAARRDLEAVGGLL